MLEGDDDAVSLLQEKEIDNLAGKMRAQTHTQRQYSTVKLNSKLSMTLVFSTFPSKTFYLQRQVGQFESSAATLTIQLIYLTPEDQVIIY